MRWPDVVKVSRAYLAGTLGVQVATRVPTNAQELDGFVRIARGPGTDDGITDAPLLDVETFGSNEGRMWQLAEDARQAMHALAGTVVDGVLVDTVDTATGPVEVDYGNPAVFRAVASYRLNLRQH